MAVTVKVCSRMHFQHFLYSIPRHSTLILVAGIFKAVLKSNLFVLQQRPAYCKNVQRVISSLGTESLAFSKSHGMNIFKGQISEIGSVAGSEQTNKNDKST